MWVKSLDKRTRIAVVAAIVISGVALDQVTKLLARNAIPINTEGTYHFFNLVRFTHVENEGAFLSLGAGLDEAHRFWVMTGLNAVILTIVLGVLLFRRLLYYPVVVSLSLVVSGGVGNLIDRIFRDGRVTDFLVVGIQHLNIPFRTGIFNIADSLIMLGLAVLLFSEFFGPKADFTPPEAVNPAMPALDSHKGRDGE